MEGAGIAAFRDEGDQGRNPGLARRPCTRSRGEPSSNLTADTLHERCYSRYRPSQAWPEAASFDL